MEVSKQQHEVKERIDSKESGQPDRFQETKKPGEDRIVMLSDGIFAIAVTLLVLGIQIPNVADNKAFVSALAGDFLSGTKFYVITFTVLAAYWLNHRRLMNVVQRIDSPFLWLNLLFLAFVAFFPVASNLLKYSQYPEAVIVYAVVLVGCGYSSVLLWIYALNKHRLVAADLEISGLRSLLLGIIITPTFFLVSLLFLFIPGFKPGNIFYSWLILPLISIVWSRVLKPAKKIRSHRKISNEAEQ